MKILAVDTSCDETCISIIEEKRGNFYIKSNIVSSQIKIHKKYGGVVPFLARREHQKNLIPVLKEALEKSKLLKREKQSKINDFKKIEKILGKESEILRNLEVFLEKYKTPPIDLVAVTKGPGLEPCLWTGINFAKAVSVFWKKPIIAVNHLEGHMVASWLELNNPKSNIKFPAIALIASGGHTELILAKSLRQQKLIGETLDDAAGECLDKIAKLINLSYPGGPEIEKLSKIGDKNAYNLPRPMSWSKDYNFSFSGLKTAVFYLTKKTQKKELKRKKTKANIAASAQQAVFDVLIAKTIKAAKEKDAKTILAGGGVMANETLKKQFKQKLKIKNLELNFLVPSKELCTDNAAMIGVAAFFNKEGKIPCDDTKRISLMRANSNLNF